MLINDIRVVNLYQDFTCKDKELYPPTYFMTFTSRRPDRIIENEKVVCTDSFMTDTCLFDKTIYL